MRGIKFLLLLISVLVISVSRLHSQNEPFALPDGFPEVEVSGHTENPTGYYFLNNFGLQISPDSAWLMILDTTGFPVYYRMMHGFNSNFTKQEQTGTLTWFSRVDTAFHELDGNYNEINTYKATNGFITDGHELRLLADGSYWLLALDIRIVDMSVLIEGGNPAADVIGAVIQHIDGNGTVLFEWNSWDHFDIFDGDTTLVNYLSPKIDYVHPNALDIVDDSTILLSSRAMNEITKINTNTGDVVWRWGGKHNEFTCLNDSVPFLAQHHIRYRGDNLYSLFDNGNFELRPYSRALVYYLNEEGRTTEVEDDFSEDGYFSRVMGSNQLLPNGNYLVGWSYNFQKNVFSEFNNDGEVVYEMRCVDTMGIVSYRALKFDWETNIFDFNTDTLEFESPVELGDTAVMQLLVTNNLSADLVLNESYITDSAFRFITSLPVTISPGETVPVDISFAPDSSKFYSAVLSLLNSNDTTRFGKQVRITGSGEFTGIINQKISQSQMAIYPNPTHDKLFVRLRGNSTTIKNVTLYDLTGREVITKSRINKQGLCNLNVSSLEKGTYIIKVYYLGGYQVGKVVIQ